MDNEVCEGTQYQPPNKDSLNELVDRIHLQMDKTEGVMFSPTVSQQRNKTTEEPRNLNVHLRI
jgi:hypothetical protein